MSTTDGTVATELEDTPRQADEQQKEKTELGAEPSTEDTTIIIPNRNSPGSKSTTNPEQYNHEDKAKPLGQMKKSVGHKKEMRAEGSRKEKRKSTESGTEELRILSNMKFKRSHPTTNTHKTNHDDEAKTVDTCKKEVPEQEAGMRIEGSSSQKRRVSKDLLAHPNHLSVQFQPGKSQRSNPTINEAQMVKLESDEELDIKPTEKELLAKQIQNAFGQGDYILGIKLVKSFEELFGDEINQNSKHKDPMQKSNQGPILEDRKPSELPVDKLKTVEQIEEQIDEQLASTSELGNIENEESWHYHESDYDPNDTGTWQRFDGGYQIGGPGIENYYYWSD
ncbi:uncharacterized protein MELLADRAFT_78140 [Melampsora larici-populina 98AG31]|uniref:Uncharacterized protein n=1 Tax=Melampsora larici-populina (strain 98AG31 / pathotype 3-4-7) TaxID=747676 RepID=F4RQT8_MELLP|nr:uncharacterized protein MELLADRAFT_78140 [Melampsora larici-populina 98AG31]EGG05266.1 hypothetical protein MELLADRAFT_78140 [Melampsora larici-populina 98AG31]